MTMKESNENNQRNNHSTAKEILLLILMCCFPLIVITGCGVGSCIQCSNCGDDNDRLFVCAKGSDANGVEYTSCVGPAGILGFGLNSKCWATECVSVKQSDNGSTLSGCVTYYNAGGCISKSEVKSVGKYSDSVTCLGIKCAGKEYVETAAETTKATEQTTCLNMSCGGKEAVNPKNYNSSMPRAFTHGCWAPAE